jgi:predicted lipid-binding transport protein (Tim44 family)
MKKSAALLAIVMALGATTASFDAEAARRLGGGKSVGMQRQPVAPPAKPGAPATQPQATPGQTPATANAPAAAAAPAAATAAAAAPKRSWMGPVAGLAAGLGLAALASHFGFGEALANFMTIALLGLLAVAVIGFILRKRAAGRTPAMAGAGAGLGSHAGVEPSLQPDAMARNDLPQAHRGGSMIGSRLGGGIGSGLGLGATAATGQIPADFDVAGFVRNAKDNFMGLQAANDARDLVRLREYLTPELYEAARADIDSRGNAPQRTEVFGLEAQVLEVVQDADRYVVSVRFTGSVRDEPGAPTEDLDETWHLVKPRSGGGWVVAGIQQA